MEEKTSGGTVSMVSIAFNKMNPALGNYEVASTTISIWVVPGVIVKGKAH